MAAQRPAAQENLKFCSRGLFPSCLRPNVFCACIPRDERTAAGDHLGDSYSSGHFLQHYHAQHSEQMPPRGVSKENHSGALDPKNLCGRGQKVMAAAHGHAACKIDAPLGAGSNFSHSAAIILPHREAGVDGTRWKSWKPRVQSRRKLYLQHTQTAQQLAGLCMPCNA